LEVLLKGRPIVPGIAKGTALVSTKPISFLGGVDPETGVVIEREHDLYGKSIKDSVLCFPSGHGSTVGSFVLYSLARRGLAPRAIVNSVADSVVVVGAIIANIPMVDEIDITKINTGEVVEVDGGSGIIRIFRK
jgi:predicted aconitase with swiveling domain